MPRWRMFVGSFFFLTTVALWVTAGQAWDRYGRTNRSCASRHGYWSFGFSGFQVGYVPVHQQPPAYGADGQLKRFFDATGRWTGDGYDSMSTAPPPQPMVYQPPHLIRNER
jgi:hypothetical protein